MSGIINKNELYINEKTKVTIDELKSYYTNCYYNNLERYFGFDGLI